MSTPPQRGKRFAFGLAAAALVALHVGLVNHFLPLSSVLDHEPVSGDDFDLHIGQVYRVLQGLEGWGKSWVYDVELLAGQPEGTISDSGSKGWELWVFAVTRLGIDKAIAFDLFVLLVMLSPPLSIFVAGRLFGMGRWASLCAAAMGSMAWFFDSFVHWVWWIGMVSYAGASALSLVPLALLHRYFETRRARLLPGCAVLLGVAHLIHPYTFFTLAPPMAALYARAFGKLGRREHLGVASLALVTLAMNGFWLRVAAEHWHYIVDSAFYGQADPRYVLADFFNLLANPADTGVIGTRTGFRFAIFALGVAGLLVWRHERDPRLLPFAVALPVLLAFSYLGGQIPGAGQIQPYRHMVPAIFLSTLPAGAFVEGLAREHALRGLHPGLRALLWVAGLLCVQHLTMQALYFLPRALPNPARFADGTPSIVSKYGFWASPPNFPSHVHYGFPREAWLEPGYEKTLAWVDANIPDGGRVLVDNTVLGERIAWKTRVEVMGGFLERNTDHAFANLFRSYRRRPVPRAELDEYLRTFAIGWVILQRPRNDLDRARDLLERVHRIGGRNIYRVRARSSPILQGGGTLHARTNLIEVRGTTPSQSVVLSYHFHEALRCRPSCEVHRERVKLDRVGLIRVPAPHPSDFEIYNSYQK
jgi:hypothetical protein